MKSTRNLRLQIRLAQSACLAALGLATTAAVSTRQLLLDAADRPTGTVSLSSPNWTGTLDAARLPAALNPARIGDIAPGTGAFTALGATGLLLDPAADASAFRGGYISTSAGNCIDTSNDGGEIVTSNNGGGVYTANGGGPVVTNDGGGYLNTSFGGGCIATNGGGGYLVTNGFGAPTDTGAPVGSLYTDQDPNGGSGHALWVMESSGWVGK